MSEIETVSPELRDLLDNLPSNPQNVVVCVRCTHVLADARDLHNIQGSTEHQFVNPYGIVHHFRCYKVALGCIPKGVAQHADSWFPSYRWRHAKCGNCDEHLGWLFESSDSFFGLLISKILEHKVEGDG